MKKYIRTLSLLLTAVLTISLTGCGSSDADGGKDRKGLMAAKELSGVWTDESGNILRLDTVESTYTYRTRYGRIGSGGSESLDGARFTPDGEIPEIPLEKLNGMWQNCEGETPVIDTSRMQYIACSKEAMSSGTVVDKQDGKGVYLFLNGFAYPRLDVGGRSLELFSPPATPKVPTAVSAAYFIRTRRQTNTPTSTKRTLFSKTVICGILTACNITPCPRGIP